MTTNAQPGGQGVLKLITVHGTGAGDPENIAGKRWWQINSEFHKALGDRIDLDSGDFEIVPFQWGHGPNLETDRRAAGKELLSMLRDYDDAGQEYVLLGHSHGGSVIYHALLRSVIEKRELTGLRHWMTVGTPFLDYRKNRFMFQRLTGLGLTIYTTGIATLLVALAYWIWGATSSFDHIEFAKTLDLSPAMLLDVQQMDMDQVMQNFAIALVVYSGVCLSVLFFLERRRKGWATVREKKRVEEWYGTRWLGLWHQEDEAISALFNVQRVSGEVIPSSFLAPIVGLTNIAVVGFFCLSAVFGIMSGDATMIEQFAFEAAAPSSTLDAETGVYDDLESDAHWALLTIYTLVVLTLVMGMVSFGTWLLKFVARAVGIPLASFFNRVIWKSVRDRTWGDDLPAEDVYSVAPHPPEFTKTFTSLPDVVSTPLRSHSDGHAISTLNKVRFLLGMAESSDVQADMRTELGQTLNWQELIHTSYFEVPEFIDLIGLHLTQAGLATPKSNLLAGTQPLNELGTWLNEQSAGPKTG